MAAYNNVLKATQKLVLDAQRNVIDEFVEFLSNHVDIDDEFSTHIKDFKSNVLKLDKTALKRRRLTPEEKAKKAEDAPKRKPSEYNQFMKSEMAVIRSELPDMESGKVFAEAVRRWQEKKKMMATAEPAEASNKETPPSKVSESDTVCVQEEVAATKTRKARSSRATTKAA